MVVLIFFFFFLSFNDFFFFLEKNLRNKTERQIPHTANRKLPNRGFQGESAKN